MLHTLVYLGLILFGVLIGMGATGEDIYDAIFSVGLPYYLLGDLKGILIAVATGVYASLVVMRYQEVRHARDDAARVWTDMISNGLFVTFSMSDPNVRRVKNTILDSKRKMAQYRQLKAYKIYDEVFDEIRKLNDFERRHKLDDFEVKQKAMLKDVLFILRKLQEIKVDWMPILRLR